MVIRPYNILHSAHIWMVQKRNDGRLPSRSNLLRTISPLRLASTAMFFRRMSRYDLDSSLGRSHISIHFLKSDQTKTNLLSRLQILRQLHLPHTPRPNRLAQRPLPRRRANRRPSPRQLATRGPVGPGMMRRVPGPIHLGTPHVRMIPSVTRSRRVATMVGTRVRRGRRVHVCVVTVVAVDGGAATRGVSLAHACCWCGGGGVSVAGVGARVGAAV